MFVLLEDLSELPLFPASLPLPAYSIHSCKMTSHQNANCNNRMRRRRAATSLHACLAGLVLSTSLSAASAAHVTPSTYDVRANAKTPTSRFQRNLQVEKYVLGKGLVTFFDKPTSANPTMPGSLGTCQISTETSSYFRESDSSAFTMAIEVPFVYEVETNAEFPPGQMNVFVLPKVEEALGNDLLPVLFAECAAGGKDAMTRKLAFDDSNPLTEGSIVGMSNSPPDLVVSLDDGAVCTATQTRPGNSCTVVQGVITVYAPTDSALASFGDDSEEKEALMDEIVSSVQDTIRDAMESGSLNEGGAGESIQRVTYSRDGSYRKPVVALGTDGNNENTTSGADGDLPIYVIVIISAVAVGAVALIVGTKIHNHRKNEEEDYESAESDNEEEEKEDDEENHDVSGFHDNPTEVAERGGKSMYDMNLVAEDDLSAIL